MNEQGHQGIVFNNMLGRLTVKTARGKEKVSYIDALSTFARANLAPLMFHVFLCIVIPSKAGAVS